MRTKLARKVLFDGSRGTTPMSTAAIQPQIQSTQVTLLELVQAVAEVTDNEREIVAAVRHMLQTGSVKLRGNFRGCSIDVFRD